MILKISGGVEVFWPVCGLVTNLVWNDELSPPFDLAKVVIFDSPDNVTLSFFTFVGSEPGAEAGVEIIDRNEFDYIFRVRDIGELVISASIFTFVDSSDQSAKLELLEEVSVPHDQSGFVVP